MVDRNSPFQISRDITAQIDRLVSGFDIDSLPAAQRKLLQSLKRQAVDVRLDLRDYGMAETAPEQRRLAKAMTGRLEVLEQSVVQVGGQGLFGPADVAQLSALIQQLMANV